MTHRCYLFKNFTFIEYDNQWGTNDGGYDNDDDDADDDLFTTRKSYCALVWIRLMIYSPTFRRRIYIFTICRTAWLHLRALNVKLDIVYACFYPRLSSRNLSSLKAIKPILLNFYFMKWANEPPRLCMPIVLTVIVIAVCLHDGHQR